MRYNKQITFLLLFGVLLVQLAGMFLPFTGDAGKYAAISKNIFESHDFWNLTIHGSPYFQKPPFLMWLSTLGYFIFGETNNFTTRFFPLLFTLLMIYSTFRLGKLFYSAKIGKIAALFIGTSQIFFLYNTDLHTDVILATCSTFTIWQLAEYVKNRKWYNFILAFVFTGFAMLTKGPIGAAVPVLAIGSHLLLNRNFKMIFRLEWLLGILITSLIVLPYLIVLYKNFGWDGPKFYFWTNNAGRISGSYKNNNIDPFFYLYNLLIFTIPWSLFFAGGLISQLGSIFKKNTEKNIEYYTLGGSVIFIVILSFASMKSPNYFYPALPLLAIVAANYYHKFSQNNNLKKSFIPMIQTILNVIIWIVNFAIVIYLFPLEKMTTWMILMMLALVFVLILIKKFPPAEKLITTSLITILALNFIINTHLLPVLFNFQASIKAAEIYNREADEDAVFYTYRYAQFEMFFYAKNKGYKIKDEGSSDDPVVITLDDALKTKGAWYLANEYSRSQIVNGNHEIEKEYIFNHYYLTDINWKFLNPKTRDSALKKIYLIKTK